MAKTRAEIQKAWRQRQKEKLGDAFLEKERKRRKQYYVPISKLPEKQKKQVRADNASRARVFRAKRAAVRNNETLTVNFNFERARVARRKKQARAVSKANRKIRKLQETCEHYYRQYRKYSKRYEREKKKTNNPANQIADQPTTPRRSADKVLRDSGLSPRKIPYVRRALIFHNAIVEEIKAASQAQKSLAARASVNNIVAGKIMRKYRCVQRLASHIAVDRRGISKAQDKTLQQQKRRRRVKAVKLAASVTEFFNRDDISRVMPGKKDVKCGQQKRVLTDYLANLHLKFLAENSDIKPNELSFSHFAKLRPSHVAPVSFGSRDICLCQKHQNFALKLRGLKRFVDTPINPDKFIREVDFAEIEGKLPLDQKFEFQEWKNEKNVETGMKKLKLLSNSLGMEDFIRCFKEELETFNQHCQRVETQFRQLRRLKSILPKDQLIVQMDFAENYTCRVVEEVQSAYWGTTGVTLHPCVVYGRDGNGRLIHKSYVLISDEMSHGTTTIFAFLKELLPVLEKDFHQPKMIHYWTDSPSSQYRNKTIFNLVANHEDLFHAKATWNYFEAGHGKGPCDGIGGTIKRLADDAAKRRVALIQDPSDFFAWTQTLDSDMSFIFVSKEDVARMKPILDQLCSNLRPVRGTMKIHSVVGQSRTTIQVAESSCFCERCFCEDEGQMICWCDQWSDRVLSTDPSSATNEPTPAAADTPPTPLNDLLQPIPAPVDPNKYIGKWVIIEYDGKPYPGKVLSVDEDDLEVQAMCRIGPNRFFWPMMEDILWYANHKIITLCDEPKPVTSRHVAVDTKVWEAVLKKLNVD